MAHLECTAQTFAACGLLDGGNCASCQLYLSLEAEIQAAKAQIPTAGQAILEAQTKQRDLRAKFNHIHDPVTNRLPPEIISEIFKSTLTRKSGMGFYAYTIDSPLFLGAVCRSWRNIAWSSPSLWNWIHIHLRFPVSEIVAELVEEWFGRSGELPLTIYISCLKGVEEKDISEFLKGKSSNIVNSVNRHSERWKNFCIACPLSLTTSFSGNGLGAPNLEMLTLDLPDDDDDDDDDGDFHYFYMIGPAPQPSHITFDCRRFEEIVIAWNHITNVYVAGLSSHESIKLVQQAPQLIHCQFPYTGADDGKEEVFFSIPSDPFVHEALQTLEFASPRFVASRFGPGERVSFFDNFTFPRLTNLTIRFYSMHSDPVAPLIWENSIGPFITRSGQQLSSLSLQFPCQSEFLLKALGATPMLRTLHLDSCLTWSDNGYDLFGLLARTRISRTLNGVENSSLEEEFLPNLRAFHYMDPEGLWSTSPWSRILDLYGPLSGIGNPHRRPLDNLFIETSFEDFLAPMDMIDSENLQRFLDLIDAGIGLRLIDLNEQDLIKRSMIHHGIDRR